jgi:hypothetical protein
MSESPDEGTGAAAPGAEPGTPAPGPPSPAPPAATAPGAEAGERQYRPATMRAFFACLLIGLVGLVSLLTAWFDTVDIALFSRVVGGGAVTQEDVNGYAIRAGVGSLLLLVAYVPAVVVFLLWVHRADANLPALGGRELKFSPGWAVGWWFVPFANVFQPLRVLREIWRASDPETGLTTARSRRGMPARLIWLWWALWMLSNVVAALARSILAVDEPDSQLAGHWIDLASNLLFAAAALAAVTVVKGADARQVEKRRRLDAGELQLASALPA